jgi:cytochrome c2
VDWLCFIRHVVCAVMLGVPGLGCGTGQSERKAEPGPSPSVQAADLEARAPSKGAEKFVPGDAERGKALVARFECNRCHDGTGHGSVAVEKHCIQCHRDIVSGSFPARRDALAKWSKTAVRYQDVPSLAGIGRRLRPEWLVEFLLEPHQVRPQLEQSMPRLPLDRQQARDIVTYLSPAVAAPQGVAARNGDASHGRELFETRGCTGCHAFGGARVAVRPAVPRYTTDTDRSVALAPDLRFTRDRYRSDVLEKWLMNPEAFQPNTRMPNLGLTSSDAADLASFILTSPLDPPTHVSVPARRPLLDRPVTFAEVNERVLMKTCRHCHTDPDKARGDGGPGNTGGFGFEPRRLDLSSYAGVSAGFLDAEGRRRSVFERLPDGTPRLVGALLARHAELAGAPGAVRGMPLGLPPVGAEEIQLVESWISQGRPL